MGLKTHHQDQVITPANFNPINRIPNKPINEGVEHPIVIPLSLIFIYIKY